MPSVPSEPDDTAGRAEFRAESGSEQSTEAEKKPGHDSPNNLTSHTGPSSQAKDAEPALPTGARRVGVCVGVALLALVLDVVSKLLVVANLPETHLPVRLLGGVLYLNQARNSGAAFSLGTGFTVILTVVAIAVVVVIARTASRLRSTAWAIALGLILGGALGNLGDRIFRAPGLLRGHVVDWISLFGPYDKYWPIFNLADSAIVCGAILAALLALLGIDFDGRHAHRAQRG